MGEILIMISQCIVVLMLVGYTQLQGSRVMPMVHTATATAQKQTQDEALAKSGKEGKHKANEEETHQEVLEGQEKKETQEAQEGQDDAEGKDDTEGKEDSFWKAGDGC